MKRYQTVSGFVNAVIVADLLLKINLSASIISIVDPACNAWIRDRIKSRLLELFM